MFHDFNQDANECIEACSDCANECKEALFQHCIPVGGRHIEASHVNLMVDCVQVCRMTADFMLRGSSSHSLICALCAEICDACAASCEQIGDDEMNECAELCRACAVNCREMSGNIHIPHETSQMNLPENRSYI